MRAPERIFLADAGDRERLTWKAGQEYVMIGDFFGRVGDDVSDKGLVSTVIFDVGFFCPRIPLTCEDALAAARFKTDPHATDPGKEINEGEAGGAGNRFCSYLQNVAKSGFHKDRARGFAPLPSCNCFRRNIELCGDVGLGEAFPRLNQQIY